MIVNVFFLAAAGDCIVHCFKRLIRPLALAVRPAVRIDVDSEPKDEAESSEGVSARG